MQRAFNGSRQANSMKRQHKLNRLHKLVAKHEPMLEAGACITTGFAEIDAYFDAQVVGNGLPCGGLHEVAAESTADMPAVLGFAHRLAGRFMAQGTDDDVLLYGQTLSLIHI